MEPYPCNRIDPSSAGRPMHHQGRSTYHPYALGPSRGHRPTFKQPWRLQLRTLPLPTSRKASVDSGPRPSTPTIPAGSRHLPRVRTHGLQGTHSTRSTSLQVSVAGGVHSSRGRAVVGATADPPYVDPVAYFSSYLSHTVKKR